MAPQKKYTKISLAERKTALLAEGTLYRTKIVNAKTAMQRRQEEQSLFQSALGQIGQTAYTAFKNRTAFRNLTLNSLLPLLAGGFSAFSKRSLLKPILYSTVLLGSAGTLVIMLKRKIKREPTKL